MNICVIGAGFVGNAVINAFSGLVDEITIVDPKHNFTIERISEMSFDAVFVCVPTPMNNDMTVDASIVQEVVKFVEEYVNFEVLAIKSTITPNLAGLLCQNPKVVYNPEFLTERNANNDFMYAKFHVVGGNSKSSMEYLKLVYQSSFLLHKDSFFFVTPEEASFIKYGINSFLATKVLWFNQLFELIEEFNIPTNTVAYNKVIEVMKQDFRIGESHMDVPGWDGRRGSAGACFAKDIPAFIKFSEDFGSELTGLKTYWNYNCDLRNSYSDRLPREVEQNIKFRKLYNA